MNNSRQTFPVNDTGMAELTQSIRESLGVKDGDEIELIQNGTQLTLYKKGRFCTLCGNEKDLYTLGKGRIFCSKCIKAMYDILSRETDEGEFKKLAETL